MKRNEKTPQVKCEVLTPWTFSLFALSAWLVGCAHRPSTHTSTASASAPAAAGVYKWQSEGIDETRAIIIAQDAVAKNDTWADGATFSAQPDGSGWSVLVKRIVGYDDSGKPKFTPGGYRLILIDKHGAVTADAPGM